jgi:RimJ/RimL family protein N-acetyltransferase
MLKEYLRKADYSDMELLYKWANNPETRANAFDSNPISFDVHQKWFKEKLVSSDVLFFIYHCDDKDVGQVRLDIKNDVAIIDYSIDFVLRGNGYGHRMMKFVERHIQKKYPEIKFLKAQVKYSNEASLNIFRKLNYTEYREPTSIRFIKFLVF